MEGCPERGVSVTVYGIPWNAMLMFDAEAGPVRNKAELNQFFEIITERLQRLYNVAYAAASLRCWMFRVGSPRPPRANPCGFFPGLISAIMGHTTPPENPLAPHSRGWTGGRVDALLGAEAPRLVRQSGSAVQVDCRSDVNLVPPQKLARARSERFGYRATSV